MANILHRAITGGAAGANHSPQASPSVNKYYNDERQC